MLTNHNTLQKCITTRGDSPTTPCRNASPQGRFPYNILQERIITREIPLQNPAGMYHHTGEIPLQHPAGMYQHKGRFPYNTLQECIITRKDSPTTPCRNASSQGEIPRGIGTSTRELRSSQFHQIETKKVAENFWKYPK